MKKIPTMAWVAVVILMVGVQVGKAASPDVKIGGEGYQCVSSENRWKIETGNSATLPAGYVIESVVVKAGQGCIEVYPVNSAPTCYSVSISGNSVTVNKIGDGPSCQDISHLEGTYIITDPPTPTPTATNTDLPTPTSTSTKLPTATATNTDLPTPTATNTDQPTATATSTQLSTATPTGTQPSTTTPTGTPLPTTTPFPILDCKAVKIIIATQYGGNAATAIQEHPEFRSILRTCPHGNNVPPQGSGQGIFQMFWLWIQEFWRFLFG